MLLPKSRIYCTYAVIRSLTCLHSDG